jgi:hypothetical protein
VTFSHTNTDARSIYSGCTPMHALTSFIYSNALAANTRSCNGTITIAPRGKPSTSALPPPLITNGRSSSTSYICLPKMTSLRRVPPPVDWFRAPIMHVPSPPYIRVQNPDFQISGTHLTIVGQISGAYPNSPRPLGDTPPGEFSFS